MVIGVVGGLVFLAHLLSALFSRTKIPDVLILMVMGILAGPVLGLVTPEMFGVIGPVFTTVTLIIILFEGGIQLRLDTLFRTASRAGVLTVLAFVFTVVGVSFLAMPMLGLSPVLAMMLGAILGGTSSSVVLPLVQKLDLCPESRDVLALESALSDMLCIVVALGLLEAYNLGQVRIGHMAGQTLSSFVLATMIGFGGALLWSAVLKRVRRIEHSIHMTPAFVFLIYAVVEFLGYSGPMASLAFGVTLGNMEVFRIPLLRRYLPASPVPLNEKEKVFFGEAVFLLKTFFFIFIGLSMRFNDPYTVLAGLAITGVLFMARVPAVWLSVRGSEIVRDAPMMAAVAPKGLAAAVLASMLLQEGIAPGARMQGVTYQAIFFSIFATSSLVFLLGLPREWRWVARLLALLPGMRGVLSERGGGRGSCGIPAGKGVRTRGGRGRA